MLARPRAVDRGQRLRHAVDERLDADEAGRRIALGLRDQVLAAAEADLEADVVGALEQRAQISGAGVSRSSASRGSSVSNSAACCGLSAWPLRRPKKAPALIRLMLRQYQKRVDGRRRKARSSPRRQRGYAGHHAESVDSSALT